MDWIEANGATFRYDLTGSGPDTVVLIHEVGGGVESFDDVLPAFAGEFRVLRYDQRGFGLSEKTSVITVEQVMADLAGLLDALGIAGPVHVAGSAMGAGLGLAFAAFHPDRVKRLAISSPATGTTPAHRAERMARIDTIRRTGVRAMVEPSLERSYPEALRGDRARYERYRMRWTVNDPESFIALQEMSAQMDLMPALGRVTCPTLVIGCTLDPIRTPEAVSQVARGIRGARYVEVASGHFMALQSPELFAKLVIPFLKGE